MAKCKDCHIPVECGCQLIQGRCSACNYTYQQSLKQQKNANVPPK